MITIKKVAVTPVAQNTGTIIDSFSTTDDKHTNAPSINAVENYVNNNISPFKPKNDFAVITGTISLTNGTGTTTIDYPTGFDASNCVPVATGINLMATNYFSFSSASTMVYETRLASSNIVVNCTSIDGVGSSSTKNVKVVLMKVS